MKHGHTSRKHGNTPVYAAWMNMKARCAGRHGTAYSGISVCARWRVFENFLADMGEPPPGMSLDRIDNKGPYSPKNCRWADRATQARNTRRNVMLTYNGVTQTLTDWAAQIGIARPTLDARIHRLGWCVVDALTVPAQVRS
jgi:hypothetical protein